MNVRNWKRGIVFSAVAIVLLLVAATLTSISFGHHKATAAPIVTVPSTSAPADFGPQKAPNQCVSGYNVVLNGNAGNRVVGEGIDTSNAAKAVGRIMTYAKHDPRILQIYWNASPLGRLSPVTNVNTLVDNGCYSGKGRDTYQQLFAEYKTATVKTTQAPTNVPVINTGVYPKGKGAFQESPAKLTGDVRSVQVTFTNGGVVYVLHRCGNVVTTMVIPSVPVVTPPASPATPSKPSTPVASRPSTPQPTPSVCTLTAPPGYKVIDCELSKDPSQNTYNCQQNGGPNCPPNMVVQPPQERPEPAQPAPGASVSSRPQPHPTSTYQPAPPGSANTPTPPPPTPGGYDGGSHSAAPAPTAPQAPPSTAPGGGDPGCGC